MDIKRSKSRSSTRSPNAKRSRHRSLSSSRKEERKSSHSKSPITKRPRLRSPSSARKEKRKSQDAKEEEEFTYDDFDIPIGRPYLRIISTGATAGNRHLLDEILRLQEPAGDKVDPMEIDGSIVGFEYELNRFLKVGDARLAAEGFCSIDFRGKRLKVALKYAKEEDLIVKRNSSGKKKAKAKLTFL